MSACFSNSLLSRHQRPPPENCARLTVVRFSSVGRAPTSVTRAFNIARPWQSADGPHTAGRHQTVDDTFSFWPPTVWPQHNVSCLTALDRIILG